MTARGAHVAGFNTGSVGVCLLGNFTLQAPTQEQLNATYALNNWLVFRLQLTHLSGHRYFNDWTVCPGDLLVNQLEDMATRAGLTFGTDGYVPTASSSDSCGCCGCYSAI